jgi:hypothetical protein
MPRNHDPLSSRELHALIGLSDESPSPLFDDEPLEDLSGDLGAVLRERYRALTQPQRFAPGDLVTWKPGLKNRRGPCYGRPAVVVEVLDTPVWDTERDSGSTYFREPLDCVLGVIWDEDPGRGEFVTFHYDSRRFQLVQEDR